MEMVGRLGTFKFLCPLTNPTAANMNRFLLTALATLTVVGPLLGQETPLVELYPNPFAETLTVALAADCDGAVAVQVIDVQGRNTLNQSVSLANSPVLTLDSLGAGIYLLRLAWEGRQSTWKVLHETSGPAQIHLLARLPDNSTDALLLYPNPVGNRLLHLRITTASPRYTLRLLSTTGQVLATQQHLGPTSACGDVITETLPTLALGHYVVQLLTRHGMTTQRLLVP